MKKDHSSRVFIAVAIFSILVLSLSAFLPLAGAQDDEPVIVVAGKDTARNVDIGGPLPKKDYASSPPIMIASSVGDGAVVAAGTAGACSDNSWNNPENPAPYLDTLFAKSFEWMVPGASKVLWYGDGWGSGYEVAYNDAAACQQLIGALENMGYTVDNTIDDEKTEINSSLLSSYDILVIPQLQVGDSGTGGDPSALPDSAVDSITSFVEGGGGLLIMEQADYGGNNYHKVQNKILSGLGVSFRFQDDQVQDYINKWGGQIYQPIANVDTATAIGGNYESATGNDNIGLDSLASLRIVKDYDVSVRAASQMGTGKSGETLTYNATVTNIGTKSDSYTVTVEDELGWSPSVSPTEISLENGENESVQVEVTVPSGLSEKQVDWITLKAMGDSGAKDNDRMRAVNIASPGEPPYSKAYLGKEGEFYFTFSVPTQRVEPPAVPIMTGVETGYSEDLTPRQPWPILYGKGEFPPAAAAALVENGRVITHSPAPFRSVPSDYYTNPSLATRDYAPLMVQWLIKWDDPKDHKFLYYINDPDEYSGVFHTAEKVGSWLNDLDNELNFDLDIKEGGEITSDLLADYSVVQIGELKRSLTASEKQAVEDWVKSGGGLFLNCQADYMGSSAPRYPNALLEELGVSIRFQDDELYDKKNWTVDGAWFPQVYLLDPTEEDNRYNIWFPKHQPLIQSLEPSVISVNGMPAVYELTIKNGGSVDSTLGIEVKETTENPKGWSYGVEPTDEVELSAGESTKVYLTVDVPQKSQMTRTDWEVRVTDLNATYLSKTGDFATLLDPNTQPSSEFEVGDTATHDNLGQVTVQKIGYNGDKVVAKVQTEGGTVTYVPGGELSSGGGGGGGGGGGLPLEIVIPVIIIVLIVIAVGAYYGKK